MARKKKALLWCIMVLALLFCLVPERRLYKDGGTVECRALLYRVTRWHAMVDAGTTREGLEVQVLGFRVYDGRHLADARACLFIPN